MATAAGTTFANLPYECWLSPLLIHRGERRRYIELMGDYTLARGALG